MPLPDSTGQTLLPDAAAPVTPCAFSSPRTRLCASQPPWPRCPLLAGGFPQIIRHHLCTVAPIRPVNGHHQRTKSLLVAASSRVVVAAALRGRRVSRKAERWLHRTPKGQASLLPTLWSCGMPGTSLPLCCGRSQNPRGHERLEPSLLDLPTLPPPPMLFIWDSLSVSVLQH